MDTRKMIIPISVMTGVGVIISFLNRNKLAKLNERVDDTKEDVKSVLRYQEERNMQMQSELDELRDEVSCCYEHFEEYKRIKDNGR